jgi:hypothetical protein
VEIACGKLKSYFLATLKPANLKNQVSLRGQNSSVFSGSLPNKNPGAEVNTFSE